MKQWEAKRCVFPFCRVLGTNKMFKFPITNKKRMELWLQCSKLDSVKQNDRICYHHFDPKYILSSQKRTILSQDAVPRWYTVSLLN